MHSSRQAQNVPPASGRVALFDIIRGFSVISMVLFHLCYDLRYLYGLELSFFHPPFQDIWRASISWTFLFVAGCMCSFSRNGLKRVARYLTTAAVVYVVTLLAAVDTPISFGIIFCMGASTLLDCILRRLHAEPQGWLTATVFFAAFLITLGVPRGYVFWGPFAHSLPSSLYATPWFSWLGFPGPRFASGDYYPVIPFALMYLSGAAAGRTMRKLGYPSWCYKLSCPALEWVGQHSLEIYIAHQPLVLLALQILI